ncbi:SPX-domain-containing protein [Auriscalpium vulgare]|uniref:SPX-domain-containing protein n=1 Tax=Auriscalpium vulgare TaxID=40419 RepID=A0ACB8S372_9AGAM|nr:SPX-domain-containing protein [Auriscalpium vulgare]
MKFSSSLKFNAVVEWWDEYIAYDALKKYIYQLEKQQHEALVQSRDIEAATERTSLVGGAPLQDTDSQFQPLLDTELRKISTFYGLQEAELIHELSELEELVKEQDDLGLVAGRLYADGEWEEDEEEEDEDWQGDERLTETQPINPPKRRRRASTSVGRISQSSTGQMREVVSPRARRVSISSTEENVDLEASLASLRQIPPLTSFPKAVPEDQEYLPEPIQRNGSRSKSPGKARTIANKLRDSIASLTSPLVPSLGHLAGGGSETIWTSKSNYAMDTQLLFKRRITNLYVQVSSLRSYVELNYSGFRKILKKYDKVTENSLQSHYLHDILEPTPPFDQASRARLSEAQSTLLHLYAKCVTRGDVAAAQRFLKLNLREHIAWERETVWRQMIGRERRGESGTPLGPVDVADEKGLEVQTPVGKLRVNRKKMWILVAGLVFTVLLNVQSVDGEEANRCLAILVFATILWASEAIPLFVTSMMIPALLVWLRVIRAPDDPSERLSPADATKWIFSVMFSPTIMLLIGGFTIAAALSRTNIDRVLITRVLSLAGTRPSAVLLAVMGVACFASMWISNVAAPTLCFTLVRPILRTLPPKSPFGPCLVLAIALAANIGGQSSPISSPQNLIALQAMDPPVDWAQWFAVALPVSATSIVLIWLLLLVSYRPARLPTGDGYLEIKSIRPTRERFTLKQWWVSIVCLGTIALWCVEKGIEDRIGDMGVIAIIPIVAFFGTGVLKKDDFEQFLWSVVFLAMGGIALGKGVTSSGLLVKMDIVIRSLVHGLSPYSVVLVLSGVVLVVSTFISHTIASVLLVPIASEVGAKLPGNQANLLIFITGLICSTGMGMPVSGFPNQTAATQEDEMGQLYLSNTDFLKNGVPASIMATLVVATLGYALMKAIGL